MKRITGTFATVLFVLALVPAASPAAADPLVRAGSVSAIINSSSGSDSYSAGAEAAGWSPTAAITVSYTVYHRLSGTSTWVKVHSNSKTCLAPATHCAAPYVHDTFHGQVKVNAHASGAGGSDDDSKTHTIG